MLFKDYLKYTGDSIEDMESMSSDIGTINKVITKFGNILYWQQDAGEVVYAKWKIPGDTINELDQDELNKIGGQYYLSSYGENMERYNYEQSNTH